MDEILTIYKKYKMRQQGQKHRDHIKKIDYIMINKYININMYIII